MEPLVGTILGVIVLHENLSAPVLAGGILILCGAGYFSVRKESSDACRLPEEATTA